jgi:hypothetical protein
MRNTVTIAIIPHGLHECLGLLICDAPWIDLHHNILHDSRQENVLPYTILPAISGEVVNLEFLILSLALWGRGNSVKLDKMLRKDIR